MNEHQSLEELKNDWKALSLRLSTLEETNRRLAHQLWSDRARNQTQTLARSYRRLAALGFSFPIIGLSFIMLDCPIWTYVIYVIFGLVAACMDLWLARFMTRTDYLSDTLVDAMRHAVMVIRYQKILTFASWCLMPFLMVPLFISLYHHAESAFYGGIVGLLIGLPLGISKDLKYFRQSRAILATLREAESNFES